MRVLANAPAQGFRGRPRLSRVVADVFDLGAARTAPQNDFGPMADQHHGETLLRIRPYVASPSGTLGSVRDLRLLGYRFGGQLARTPPRPSRRRPPVQMIACVPPNQTGSAGWSEGHNNSAPLTKRRTSLRLLPSPWGYSPQLFGGWWHCSIIASTASIHGCLTGSVTAPPGGALDRRRSGDHKETLSQRTDGYQEPAGPRRARAKRSVSCRWLRMVKKDA